MLVPVHRPLEATLARVVQRFTREQVRCVETTETLPSVIAVPKHFAITPVEFVKRNGLALAILRFERRVFHDVRLR